MLSCKYSPEAGAFRETPLLDNSTPAFYSIPVAQHHFPYAKEEE